MPRPEDLEAMRDELKRRMAVCQSDQNYVIMGRLLADVLKQIDEPNGAATSDRKETGLSDFEKRLRDREQRAKAPRRTKSK